MAEQRQTKADEKKRIFEKSAYKISNTMPPAPKFIVCLRCGQIGHTTDKCRTPIPSSKEMEHDIQVRLDKITKSVPSCWTSDKYGLYMPPSDKEITEGHTWEDGEFCFNCGEFGHNEDNCPEPKILQMTELFRSTITSDEKNTQIRQNVNFVEAIRELHDQNCSNISEN